MKPLRYPLLLLISLLTACAQSSQPQTPGSGQWQPTQEESDAFVKAFSFQTLKALAQEKLSADVKAGRITSRVATCAGDSLRLDQLLPSLRPLVANSFRDRSTLKEATAFFLSPLGNKISDYFKETAMNGQEPGSEPGLPAGFTEEDGAAMDRFEKSPAGQDFDRFLSQKMNTSPKMNVLSLLDTAVVECKQRFARTASRETPAAKSAQQP